MPRASVVAVQVLQRHRTQHRLWTEVSSHACVVHYRILTRSIAASSLRPWPLRSAGVAPRTTRPIGSVPCYSPCSVSNWMHSIRAPPQWSLVTFRSSTHATRHTDPEGYHRELLRWSETILHPVRTPLGSLQATAAWNEVLTAMHVWLERRETEPIDAATLLERPILPRHVDMVDRLLVRLWYEHKSTRPCTITPITTPLSRSQQRDQILYDWTVTVFTSWLNVSVQCPDARMAVDKATYWYQILVQHVPPTHNASSRLPDWLMQVVDAHHRLVDSVLALDSPPIVAVTRAHGVCRAAADLLLAETTLRDVVPHCLFDESSRLKVAYQSSLKQTLALLSLDTVNRISPSSSIELTQTASALLETMGRLALLPGWENVQLRDDDLDAVLDALFLDSSDAVATAAAATATPTLSDFERHALQQRIIARIDQASTVRDQDAVEDLVVYWRTHMHDTETVGPAQWKPFAKAVTSFYLKIQNPEKSTRWMQIQEQMPSADVVVDAMPSRHRNNVGTENDGTQGDSFVELDALNRVFAENEIERVHQKMNLLDIWLTKVDSPIVPWRATEILESLETEPGATLDAHIYATIVQKWLDVPNAKTATGMASDKALEVALRCPTFHVEILSILLQLLVDRQVANDSRTTQAVLHPATLNLVHLLEKNVDDIAPSQRSQFVVNALRLLGTHHKSREFLDFVLDRAIPITPEMAEAAVQAVPMNVEPLLRTFDTSADVRPQWGFRFNCVAVRYLLQHPSPRLDMMTFLHDAMNSLSQGEDIVVSREQGRELAELVSRVLNQGLKESPDEAWLEALLLRTEEVLLKTESNLDSQPVLLDFYDSVVMQLAAHGMVGQVETIVNRLKEHYRAGYKDVYPSNSIHGVLMAMFRESDWLGSLNKRIGLWLELIEKYEATDKVYEWYKPGYDNFDVLVGDLFRRSELAKTGKDQIEKDSRTAIYFLRKMHSLQIKPSKRTRAYPFNVAMDLVLACRHEHLHFKLVMTLKTLMDELDIEPNFFTMQKILRACERAPKAKYRTFQAMTVMLQMLIEIRKLGRANSGIYSQCFRVLLAAHEALSPHERPQFDKMSATVFQCCIDDGCLAHTVRTNFRLLATRETFQQLYEQRLQNGDEPEEWTRNHGKVF